MTDIGWGYRRALALLAAGTIFSTGGAALAQQAQFPPGAVVQPLPAQNPAGAELRRHLSDLADNPRNLPALVGAGRAALTLGDAQAALTFFGRAEEVAPRDPRVKAGMASALVHMEQAQHALRIFAEAVSYGAPEVEIAKERGLAYDMVGESRRAQQDYAMVLRRGDDPEARRRLALSLAISGERQAAVNLIDAGLRRHDRGAWRTRAFILALTGDAAGANQAAEAVMPAQAAQAMAPFLARLPVLNPAQKAMAVHFGHFPSDGQPARMAQTDTRPYPGALAMAGGGRPDAGQAPLGGQAGALAPRNLPPEPVSTAQRRRPGAVDTTTRGPRRPATAIDADPIPRQTRQQQAQARQQQPAPQPQARPAQPQVQPPPAQYAQAQPQPVQQAPAPQPQPVQQAPAPPPQPVPQAPAPQPQPVQQAPAAQPQPQQTQPALAQQVQPEQQQPQPQPQQPQPQQHVQAAAIQPVALPPAQVPGPVAQAAPAPAPPPAAATPENRPGFDQIAALVSSLPANEAPPAARPAQPRPAPAQTAQSQPAAPQPAPAQPAPRSQPAPEPRSQPAQPRTAPPARPQAQRPPARPAHPSRHWVQVAGGANKATLPREFARLKTQAPALLGSRTAWTTPLRATNRLLVGPFGSDREAQEFVNQLARADISAFSWTSPEGQEIERLPNP